MIARMWRGWVRTEQANAYAAYITGTGLREYAATPGNLGAARRHLLVRAARMSLRYMPVILRGKPVLLNKRDMFDANLNRLPPDKQEAVYAKTVPAPGRQGRQMMLGISVSPKKVSGPRLIQSGTDDRLIPASVHRKMAHKFGSTYREYAGHGHYLMREPGWEVIADDAASWIEEHTR